MAKKKEEEGALAQEAKAPVLSAPVIEKKRERIAIVMKNFNQLIQSGPSIHHRHIKGFKRGEIVWKQDVIDELVKINAPLEVYYRDVD